MKLKKSVLVIMHILLIVLILAILSPSIASASVDHFSDDSNNWKYIGSAYRSTSAEWAVLTENQNLQTGVIWNVGTIGWPLVASFNYKAGGGSGGDGFVFMFYKDKVGNNPPGGGNLGFRGLGYGIEFDSIPHSFDPQGKHVAIIKDGVTNHLASRIDDRVADNRWHTAVIVVDASNINVYIDGALVLIWSGNIDTTYWGNGFSAATGGLNNWHLIDNVWVGGLDNYEKLHGSVSVYEASEKSYESGGKEDSASKKGGSKGDQV